jgi:large subunit ribosomal protein L25
MAEILLKATKRTEFKKSTSRQYRKNGFIPGVFYGSGEESISIVAKELALRPILFSTESNIVTLEIEGETKPLSCILKEAQYDPLTGFPLHFDLLALKEGELITLEVNVKLKGNAVGVKDGGILQHNLHKLEIECLPQHIPSNIEIDITELKIGDSIRVSDLKLENIAIQNDESASVVSVVHPVVEAEPAPAEAAAAPETAEPEVIAKGKKEDEE